MKTVQTTNRRNILTSKGLKFAVVFGLMGTLFMGGNPSGADAASSNLITPTEGRVSSEYGPRWGTFHHGIDYANVRGTSVAASADGVVTRAAGGCGEGNQSCNGGFGNVIYVKHTMSSGEVYTTVYGHLSSINVQTGQQVSQGQVIGEIGSTGNSTGPHLHFEVHEGNFSRTPSNSINPRYVLNGEYTATKSATTSNTNTTATTNKVVKHVNPSSGIGEATSIYQDGYGINMYDKPNGNYVGQITKKMAYKVHREQDGWLNLGGNQWVKAEHMTFERYTASSKYRSDYAVNLYSAPNGSYKGRIYSPTSYKVYQRVNGWVDLGDNQWVKEEHLNIK